MLLLERPYPRPHCLLRESGHEPYFLEQMARLTPEPHLFGGAGIISPVGEEGTVLHMAEPISLFARGHRARNHAVTPELREAPESEIIG